MVAYYVTSDTDEVFHVRTLDAALKLFKEFWQVMSDVKINRFDGTEDRCILFAKDNWIYRPDNYTDRYYLKKKHLKKHKII